MVDGAALTFLFTDIEGSTRLAQQYPADLPTLLTQHHAILHGAIEAQRKSSGAEMTHKESLEYDKEIAALKSSAFPEIFEPGWRQVFTGWQLPLWTGLQKPGPVFCEFGRWANLYRSERYHQGFRTSIN